MWKTETWIFVLAIFALVHTAAGAQAKTPQRQSVSQLSEQLRSRNRDDRLQAVIELSAFRSKEAISALASALTDRDAGVRAAAFTALGDSRDPAIVSTLISAFSREKSGFVRKAAIYALGRLGGEQAVTRLVESLRDKDAEVRGAAAVALGQNPSSAAIEELARTLDDSSAFVRARAAAALGANGRSARNASARLIRRLESDGDQEVKRQAARALGLIGDKTALPVLRRAAEDADPYLSLTAIEAIKRLVEIDSHRQ